MTTTQQHLIPSITSTTITYGDIEAVLTINTATNRISVDVTAPDYNVEVDHPTHGWVITEVDVAIDWAEFDDLTKAIDWAEHQVRNWDGNPAVYDMAQAMLMDELDNEEPEED